MDKKFPVEFQKYIKSPMTKAAFFSEIHGRHPRDCKNCGGIGTMIIFVATEGPFNNVPSGKEVIAHWSNDKWWGGKNFEEACPVCHGTGNDPSFVEKPATNRVMDISGVVK